MSNLAWMPGWLADWTGPWVQVLGGPVSRLEALALVLSVAMVVGNIRERVWAWPLAIVSSIAYSVVFAAAGLYGEAMLQWMFVAVALWGWLQWARGRRGDGSVLRPRRLTTREMMIAAGAFGVLAGVFGLLLHRVTDSTVPWLDAVATSGSVVGQALLGVKAIANWPVWVAVNLFSAGLFWHKGLQLTTWLYLLFAAMAVVGWRQWARALPPSPVGPR